MSEFESLNVADLDVEALEKRLELVEPGASEGYYCFGDTVIVVPDQPVEAV
ncbi:MAG TPA: hypothetical protein VE826_13935 [Dongiaceae bacterium]|nr:hypothetical protein [Dongiaceae bacterium]